MKNQEIDFYQTPSDCSDEEIQRSCEFVKKVKELDDKTIIVKFVNAMKSYHYQSKSLSYIDLKTKFASILRNHDVLLQEFYQLLLDSPITEKNCNSAKSDVERTVEFMNKVEALGKDLHGAFLNLFAFGGDIVTLIEQFDVIFRDHASLKEEFKAFLSIPVYSKTRNVVLRRRLKSRGTWRRRIRLDLKLKRNYHRLFSSIFTHNTLIH